MTKLTLIIISLYWVVSLQSQTDQPNGYIKIYEEGDRLYLLVSENEYKKLKSLPLKTMIYYATPKRVLKGNLTESRFLREENLEELSTDFCDYLKANSLIMLSALAKDVIDCDNPYSVKIVS